MHDLKFAFRQSRKNPGFTAVAVLTLALGIGGSTAVFSIINAVLLRPLPYPEAERLVQVWSEVTEKGTRKERSAYANYLDWKNQCTAFEDLAAYDGFSCLLTGPEHSEKVSAVRTSASFFSVLGVAPRLGRTFTTDDESQRSRLAVLSYGLWQRRFAGASNVVGRTLEIDGQSTEIIGVMPQGFAFPADDDELWDLRMPEPNEARGLSFWAVAGRLKRGQSPDQAQAELRSVAARLARDYPANRGLSARLVPLSEEIAGPNLRLAFWVLFGAVLCVLLIGCSNLANLLLVRGVARQRELATRLALGASPFRVMRQLVVECLPTGLAGGLAGVALAALIVRAVRELGGIRIPRLEEVNLDSGVVCFALGLTGLATLLCAIVSGLQTRRLDVNESLKEGARGSGGSRQASLRQALVIGEVALAFMLLFGAGLLLRSFQSVRAVDTGFDPAQVLCANTRFPQTRSGEEAVVFYEELSRRLEALPGVEAVGLIEDFFGGGNTGGVITIEEQALAEGAEVFTPVRRDAINPSWFQAVGVPLLKGRFFDERDRTGSLPAAIINETMAQRFWPGQDPLGKRFKLGRASSGAPWLTVVGISRDMRRERLELAPLPQVFRPLAQFPSLHMELLVKSDSSPMALAEAVRQEIQSLDKSVAVYGGSTLEQRIGASLAERRFQTSLLSAFSAAALLLAAIGTYGIVHFSVQQRTREIGIRMVLGAQRRQVLSLVIGQGLKLVLAGVGLGIALALAITRLMSGLLFEVKSTDPFTLAAVSLLLLGMGLLACGLPLRRAMRVDPMTALRQD